MLSQIIPTIRREWENMNYIVYVFILHINLNIQEYVR